MRRRYRWNAKLKQLVEVPLTATQESLAPLVMNDLPGYQSPVTGEWVEGRRARREDLKRSGCRPYEGREQEQKEADRYNAEQAAKEDRRLTETLSRNFYQIPYRTRKILEGKE